MTSADVAQLELALSQLAHLVTRVHRNELITAAAGVALDRAAVTALRRLAGAGSVRPGELAAALDVEPPHVTRQVERLQQAGYARRVPDPGDLRARRVELTSAGEAASARLADEARRGIAVALAGWPEDDLHQLATLLSRMLDDLTAPGGGTPPAQ